MFELVAGLLSGVRPGPHRREWDKKDDHGKDKSWDNSRGHKHHKRGGKGKH
jgi:hypothetical protein